MDDLWVFGYGSLIWRPGFVHRAAYPARLYGFHRALCVYSHVHRGTPQRPGLVMGLNRGGSCQGVAFHVDGAHAGEVMAYLRAREQATMVYREQVLKVHLAGREPELPSHVLALVYCVDRTHEQYAGTLSRQAQLEIIRGAVGQSGQNPEYVIATNTALAKLGVHDANLSWLAARLDARQRQASAG